MKDAKLNVISFEEGDVIATSGLLMSKKAYQLRYESCQYWLDGISHDYDDDEAISLYDANGKSLGTVSSYVGASNNLNDYYDSEQYFHFSYSDKEGVFYTVNALQLCNNDTHHPN